MSTTRKFSLEQLKIQSPEKNYIHRSKALRIKSTEAQVYGGVFLTKFY